MKGPLDRTKVVLRHLPPTITQANLVEYIDSRFAGRYHWIQFRSGKLSQKRQIYSRAYIGFNKPDDVINFAAFFNGHAFVNEKGTQYKAIVEYAPSQRVPRGVPKKDGREGTIEKDPEYMEFLESIAKPVENLPSAEIQLERREAERAGSQKESLIVTPLMEYVRQKRAAKRNIMNGKHGKRGSALPLKNAASMSSKKGSDKRNSSTMYVLRENPKNKLLQRDDDLSYAGNKSHRMAASEDRTIGESGGSTLAKAEDKKVLLLKGKETEILQNTATALKLSHDYIPSKQIQRREAGVKVARSILKREVNQGQLALGSQTEQDSQLSSHDPDPRTPQISIKPIHRISDGVTAEKVVLSDVGTSSERHDRRSRNKDRPDRIVWTPHQPSDGSHASHELSSSPATKSQVADAEEMRSEPRSGEYRPSRSRRGGHYSTENGSYRPLGRRPSGYGAKDADGSPGFEGKPSKRFSGHGSHEKQVWVQKSGSGT